MSRPPSPWFRSCKNAWYAWHEGKLRSLGVKGKENEKEAKRAWHRLMGGMPPQPPPMPAESPVAPQAVPTAKADGTWHYVPDLPRSVVVSVGDVIAAFLDDCEGRDIKPNTRRVYRRYLEPFADK